VNPLVRAVNKATLAAAKAIAIQHVLHGWIDVSTLRLPRNLHTVG
jgi:hypothetical protein